MAYLEKFFTVNVVLGKGTPCHHFLFVLAVDFLQTILNAAKQQGILSLPMNLPHDQDFPILKYADDTLIFMQGDARQLFFFESHP